MSDEFGIGTIIGSGLNFIGGLAANATNRRIAQQNIDFQREANAQNVAFQKEINSQNIAFQQRENEITRSREDNAVQRAAADMQAAGLSKTLAAGNPASAAALNAPSANAPSVKALNNQFRYESALQKLNLGSLLLDMASKKKDLEIKEDIADAQIRNMNAQTAGQELSNGTFMEEFNLNKEFKFAQTHYQEIQSAKVEAETELIKTQGQYEGQKILAEISKLSAERVSLISKNQLTLKEIKKISQDIAESMARIKNLNETNKKLVYEVAYADLQNQVLTHNLDYASRNDLPVGTTLNGTWGSLYNLLNTIISNGKTGSGLFSFFPDTTPISVPKGGGSGSAW